MAALLHSYLDHQRMLMRRRQGRISLMQIGPTSRTRDSVWFLFPCQDFGPVKKLSKLIPDPLHRFKPAHSFPLREECFSQSKENVRAEDYSDAPLLLRYGRLRLQRAYHRLRRRIPTLNLPPTIALH